MAGNDTVTDRLCHERMEQLEQEIKGLEKTISHRLTVSETTLNEKIATACKLNALELKALKNYIVGMGVGISLVIVLVNLLLYGPP